MVDERKFHLGAYTCLSHPWLIKSTTRILAHIEEIGLYSLITFSAELQRSIKHLDNFRGDGGWGDAQTIPMRYTGETDHDGYELIHSGMSW